MTAVTESISAAYRPAEHHAFNTGGRDFLYLVPSGAVFGLDGLSKEIFSLLLAEPMLSEDMVKTFAARGYGELEIQETLSDMESCDVIVSGEAKAVFPALPEPDFPLQRIVLNTTNQCNLACGYCYEYSDDKIAQTKDKPKYMSEEVAEAAIETLIRESAGRPLLHVTFF